MTKAGFFIDPHGYAHVCEIPDSLEGYYELLGCETIDIVSRKIGGKYYDIVCDDEGLFKDDFSVSMVDADGNGLLVGKLLICNHDGDGNEVGLSDDDIDNITQHLVRRIGVVGGF